MIADYERAEDELLGDAKGNLNNFAFDNPFTHMRLKALKLMLAMAIPPRWLYRIRTALLMLYGIASGLMALLILSCFRHLT